MAKTKTAQKKVSQTVVKTVSIAPVRTEQTLRMYINFAQVVHSQHEFNIMFCDIPPVGGDSEGVVRVPVKVETIISPEFMPKLIDALQTNYQRYLSGKK